MNRLFYLPAMALLFMAGVASFSCVDPDYRIKGDDIDGTIEIAPDGIEIPLAYFGEYRLSEYLGDLDKMIDGEDGYYAIHARGDVSKDIPGLAIFASSIPGADGFFDEPLPTVEFPDDLLKKLPVGTRVELAAPRFTLSVVNPTGVAAEGSLKMETRTEVEGAAVTSVEIPGIAMASDATSWIFIADSGVNPPADHDYVVLNPDNFSDFMRYMPRLIDAVMEVRVQSGGNVEGIIDPDANYPFEISYDVQFPLEFGDGMDLPLEIPPTEGMSGTFESLADTGIEMSQFRLFAELEATFPFVLSDIDITFLDVNGNKVPGIEAAVEGTIEGPAPGGDPRKSIIEIPIEISGGGDFEVFAGVDGMRFDVTISTAPGSGVKGFRPDDYISGRVWGSIPEGLEIDILDL